MSKSKSSSQALKKTKYFWLYFLVAAIGSTLGVFLMPIWLGTKYFWRDWGNNTFELILCCLLVMYIFLFFVPRIKSGKNKGVHTLWLLETGILVVLAVLCLLGQLGILSFVSPCLVFGIAFWLRGTFHIVKTYLHEGKGKKGYPLFLLLMSIVLITLGTYLILRPIAGNLFLWAVSLSILVFSAVALLLGFLTIPPKKKKADQ